MAEVIRLLKVSPAEQAGNTMPFLVAVRAVTSVEIPDSPVEAPTGVFLVELSDRPGRFWTWDLNPGDLNPGTPINYERLPQ